MNKLSLWRSLAVFRGSGPSGRNISQHPIRYNQPSPVPPPLPKRDTDFYEPNKLERRFLVWAKKYKTTAEVPKYVAIPTMERARSLARIRIANCMILASIVGCIAMVISGKNASKRGESLQKMNLDWHEKFNAENK